MFVSKTAYTLSSCLPCLADFLIDFIKGKVGESSNFGHSTDGTERFQALTLFDSYCIS